ncbi:hypothetical protein C2E23DRAFT_744207 [Lenzites betulinus]|nr:hypothetical protein C2E23DRAFT_744207 [Lenzites betulinus]
MSPWLPAGPGRHGFMHMDVGKDMELLQDGDTQHVFVGGLGRSSKLQPRYMYCGEYRIARQAPLTLAEWKTLPLQVRTLHAETALIKDSTLTSNSVRDVLKEYDTGELRLNCVRLECIEFDTDFYQGMLDGRPVTPGLASPEGSRKRRRHQQDETNIADADASEN